MKNVACTQNFSRIYCEKGLTFGWTFVRFTFGGNIGGCVFGAGVQGSGPCHRPQTKGLLMSARSYDLKHPPPRRCLPQGHKLSEDTQQHNAPFLHQGCEKETQGERNFDCALRLGNVSGLCAHISVFFLSYGNLYPFFSLCCLWIP